MRPKNNSRGATVTMLKHGKKPIARQNHQDDFQKENRPKRLTKKNPTSHNKTVDLNKNKADVIKYLNRQQKILQIIDIIEEEEIAKKHLQCINSTKNVSISNPEKFISYNTNKLLQNLPSWLYFSRPNNIAYHNLTASSETALLGIKIAP